MDNFVQYKNKNMDNFFDVKKRNSFFYLFIMVRRQHSRGT